MSELIKREDAIKATWHEPSYIDPYNVLTEVRDRIEALPTVDAVPVVHGEWIETEMGYDDYAWVCTVCGEPWVLNAGTPSENNMNYCPNCGARMRGEHDEQTDC